jgi:type I restriction enzyme, R subunit
MRPKAEAQARIRINRLLEEAGWRFFDDDGVVANIICEHRVTKRRYKDPGVLGLDFEQSENGFIDYLLLNNRKQPVAVVEAKSEKKNPLDGKEQARKYANSLNVRYVFLSNGNVHYYWDILRGNPTRISRFLNLEQLGQASRWTPNPQRLAEIRIDENYVAVSQDSNWPQYSAQEKQRARIDKNIKLLRDYQVEAAHVIQKTYFNGKNRFLLEMATGTGKTLLSATIVKLFIRSGNADRVLFLVDRLELERQAWKNFNAYLANDGISTVIYKENKYNWIRAQVVITTIQSLSYGNRFVDEFSPHDFQLIVSDEAHRTISGSNRVIFEYFIGSKLGLTATPRDYLKGVDPNEMGANDPRQLELRQLLDTYHTFGCENGIPTFRFSLIDAVNHVPPYLVNPKTFDARTDVTTELLTKQGWVTKFTNDDGEEEEQTYYKEDFERKFFSPETNLAFVSAFLDQAKRDPITGEIGKTIMFAISRNHASKLTKLLNEEVEKLYPGKYNSDFAVQVTSNIAGAQGMTVNFANNNLNGITRFRPELIDYHSSKTRVCVTVGMMTTGYDCEDLLNIALCRPIFSPTDFIQIKGRGTRLYTFTYSDGTTTTEKPKDNYFLFDFFANCEYFEKEFNYSEIIELPPMGEGGGGDGPQPDPGHIYTGPDDIKTLVEEEIGKQGMRIDREMYSKNFENKTKELVQQIPELVVAVNQDEWDKVEEFVKASVFNKPEEFWNTEKLRESYGVKRRLTLVEILKKVFGKIDKFKTKEEIVGEYFERFLSVEGVDGSKVHELRSLFTAYLLYGEVRDVLDRKEFGRLATDPRLSIEDLDNLGADQIKLTMDYIKDNVPINQFLG